MRVNKTLIKVENKKTEVKKTAIKNKIEKIKNTTTVFFGESFDALSLTNMKTLYCSK